MTSEKNNHKTGSIFSFTNEQKHELKKWAEELEMTTLKKGTCTLRAFDSYNNCFEYCCLGIYAVNESSVSWEPDKIVSYRRNFEEFYCKVVINDTEYRSRVDLPDPLRIKLGLTESLERFFTYLNDMEKFSFCDIAKEIRSLEHWGTLTKEGKAIWDAIKY